MYRIGLFLWVVLTACPALATSLPSIKPVAPPNAWIELCGAMPSLCTSDGPESIALTEKRLSELAGISRDVTRNHPWRKPEGSWRVLRDREPGSCADLAITAKARLIEAGWPASVLRPAILWIRKPFEESTPHMVLTIEAHDGTYVLDNLHPGKVYRFTDTAFRYYRRWYRTDSKGTWWRTFDLPE